MKNIKKIIIGTNNKGKYREIASLLPKKIAKYSPENFKIKSPKEDGKTFEENSYLKARFFSKKTNLICISDDSGLIINALNGKPGIHSARWAGKGKNFNYAIKKVFKEMDKKNKYWKKSKAHFICSLTIYYPNGKFITKICKVNGYIINHKRGKKGFGYDPIFVPKNYSKTFGEMNFIKKKSIDHRYKAFLKIKKYFY